MFVKEFTNNQKGRLNLYKESRMEILNYLATHEVLRNYKVNHRKAYSYTTYHNVNILKSRIKTYENHFRNIGISVLKVQKMNRYVKKIKENRNFNQSKLDLICKIYISDFLKSVSLESCIHSKEILPNQFEMKQISDYKSLKRKRALKTLNPRIQARIINKRLKRLFYALNPKGTPSEFFVFLNETLSQVEKDENYLPNLVKRAKAITPGYEY